MANVDFYALGGDLQQVRLLKRSRLHHQRLR